MILANKINLKHFNDDFACNNKSSVNICIFMVIHVIYFISLVSLSWQLNPLDKKGDDSTAPPPLKPVRNQNKYHSNVFAALYSQKAQR